MKRTLVLAILLLTTAAIQAQPVNRTFFGGEAIHGFDVVSYFKGGPVKGKPEFFFQYRGARWLFASAEHLKLFRDAPESYAPRYGGYCAFAMARGESVDIDPFSYAIVDHKLYLNYDREIQKQWEANRTAFIQKADKFYAKH